MTKLRLNYQTAGGTFPVMFVDSTGPWNGSAHVAASSISDVDLQTAVNAVAMSAVTSQDGTVLYYEATVPDGVSTGASAFVFSGAYTAGSAWFAELSIEEGLNLSALATAAALAAAKAVIDSVSTEMVKVPRQGETHTHTNTSTGDTATVEIS